MNVFGQTYSTQTIKSTNAKKLREFGLIQMHNLLNFVDHPLTDPYRKHVFDSMLELRQLKKGEHFVKQGDTSAGLAFVVTGALCIYNQPGDTRHILMIFDEGNFATSLNPLRYQTPSPVNVVASQNTSILELSKEKYLQYMASSYGKGMATAFQKIFSRYESYVNELLMIQRLRCEEKVEALKKLHPSLLMNVQAKYVASLLNMKDETLSRIKKNNPS